MATNCFMFRSDRYRMLSAVSTSSTGFPAPNFDAAATIAEAPALVEAAKARDWPTLEAGFAQLTDPGVFSKPSTEEQFGSSASMGLGSAPGAHLIAVRAVQEALDLDFAEETFSLYPTSALAGTLLAGKLIEEGWEIRSGGWAKNVSREQWRGFYKHLNRAEQILIEVTARNPEYTSAWIHRMEISRGISLGQAESKRRYSAIMKVAPTFYAAHSAMLAQLCPKWSGSYDAMHGFATERSKASVPGSLTAALVPTAHIEHWLLLDRDEDAAAALAYLKSPQVRQEINWAAAHSVLNPAFRLVPGWVGAHSTFAMAYSLAEDYRAAAAHFNVMYHNGNLGNRMPWCYLGEAPARFMEHRDRAFQEHFQKPWSPSL
jgi:hypothetical protein